MFCRKPRALWLFACLVWLCACSENSTTSPVTDAEDASEDPSPNTPGDNNPAPTPDLPTDAPPEQICDPGEKRCASKTEQEICSNAGDQWIRGLCTTEERCDDESNTCLPIICTAGQLEGCSGPNTYAFCNETGTRTQAAPCPGGGACVDGACDTGLCTPGQTRCAGDDQIEICLSDGSDFGPPQDCETGQQCADNLCQDLCTLNQKISSYIGCEYWSLDLDNYDDATFQEHAIVVSNPNPELTASILITRPNGAPVEHDGPLEIPPLGQGVYSMPSDSNLSLVEISNYAFRVLSNIPVTAHQFNPLNNVDVYSNDASLLLPTNTLGTRYIAMSWQQRPNPPLRGFVTIFNPAMQDNEVTFTTTARTAPGPEIPSMDVGETRTFTLGAGQVLNLETRGDEDDLTGSLIESQYPVGVFGGHECANVDLGIDRCDHIETQLLPVDTWGTTYLGTKFSPRGGEPDVWRILASEDNTIVTLSFDFPNTTEQVHHGNLIRNEGGAQFLINRGEYAEFQSRQAFQVEGNAPISVGQYMVGSNWFTIPRICDEGIDAGNPTGIGDPAMTLAVPTSQFRDEYILLVPLDYAEDYVNVVISTGTQVTMDGNPLDPSLFEPIEGTGYQVATLTIEDGQHRLTGDAPFGLQAYGYDCHVSYAYPGGLNLEVRENP